MCKKQAHVTKAVCVDKVGLGGSDEGGIPLSHPEEEKRRKKR